MLFVNTFSVVLGFSFGDYQECNCRAGCVEKIVVSTVGRTALLPDVDDVGVSYLGTDRITIHNNGTC